MSAPDLYRISTKAAGPGGKLPLTGEMLRQEPSGNLFALSQNAGMGWRPAELIRKNFLILSTQGGLRAPDGSPIALGYHTGHWEIAQLVAAAAEGDLVYAVPGSPLVLERTVELLRGAEAAGRVVLDIVPAMSFLDVVWARLKVDPVESSVRLIDGHVFATGPARSSWPTATRSRCCPRSSCRSTTVPS